MIKFIAGFVTAWIMIKNPGILTDILAMLGTLLAAIRDAFQAASSVGVRVVASMQPPE